MLQYHDVGGICRYYHDTRTLSVVTLLTSDMNHTVGINWCHMTHIMLMVGITIPYVGLQHV